MTLCWHYWHHQGQVLPKALQSMGYNRPLMMSVRVHTRLNDRAGWGGVAYTPGQAAQGRLHPSKAIQQHSKVCRG